MPIRRPQPAIIDEPTLRLGLSLEALGLWAHIQMQTGATLDIERLEAQFATYDVGKMLQELLGAGLLGDEDEAPAQPVAPIDYESRGRDCRAFVYALQAGDNFKVGVTGNLKKRVKDLQVANANTIIVIWHQEFASAVRIESRMHFILRRYRVSGEWFRCDLATLHDAISKVRELR